MFTISLDLTQLLAAIDDFKSVFAVSMLVFMWAFGFSTGIKLMSLLPS